MTRRLARDSSISTSVVCTIIRIVLLATMLGLTSFVPLTPSGRADAAPARRRAVALSRQAQTAYDQKQYAASADAYRRLIELYPYDFVLHFNRACALAHDGKSDEALASLALAVRYGFEDVDLLEKSRALDPLRADARFAQLERDARACCDERFLVYAPP